MLFLASTAAYINIFFRFIKFYEIIIADTRAPRKFLFASFFISKDPFTFEILSLSKMFSYLLSTDCFRIKQWFFDFFCGSRCPSEVRDTR